MKWKRSLTASLVVAVFGMGLAAGFLMPRDDDFFAIRKNFEIYGAIYEALVGEYVDPLDPNRLMQAGVEAMLADLDPYTTFIDEAESMDMRIRTRGEYGSVGLELGRKGRKMTVTAPREQASAYRQGIRTGDVILRIDGQPTDELTLQDAHTLLRGEPGTTVPITVRRTGEPEPLSFTLTRRKVDPREVSYAGFVDEDPATGIGYVKLDRFGRSAGAEVRQAIQGFQKEGALKGLVLDLRDNPGGLLRAAVDVTSLFVPEGSLVVSMRGRTSESERVFRSDQPPLVPDVPLVVLVNDLSASASEIVAGAVQDLDRGVIVGTTTYGKGLVQKVKKLPYNTGLKLTLARYYTPSGRSIQARDYSEHDGTAASIPDSLRKTYHTASGRPVQSGSGIEPDVVLAPGAPSDLEQALRREAAFFFFANEYAAQHASLPADFAVTDELLGEFEAWLADQNFTYKNDAQEALAHLATQLDDAGYQLSDQVASLRSSIREEKEADFERHQDRLKKRLREEIRARYLEEREQVKASLSQDEQTQKALQLLRDTSAYRSILD